MTAGCQANAHPGYIRVCPSACTCGQPVPPSPLLSRSRKLTHLSALVIHTCVDWNHQNLQADTLPKPDHCRFAARDRSWHSTPGWIVQQNRRWEGALNFTTSEKKKESVCWPWSRATTSAQLKRDPNPGCMQTDHDQAKGYTRLGISGLRVYSEPSTLHPFTLPGTQSIAAGPHTSSHRQPQAACVNG